MTFGVLRWDRTQEPRSFSGPRTKRAMDPVAASVGLVASAPVVLPTIFSCLVKIETRRSISRRASARMTSIFG